MQTYDVIIIGGGIGGSALAASLAQGGLAVELLEREAVFEDRVRGEWMAPWGVAEAKALGVYDVLMAAGGHHVKRAVNYDELLPPATAEAIGYAVDAMHPVGLGPLCMEHVAMQNALLGHAMRCGATVRRGVSEVEITGGPAPRVSFREGDTVHTHACRLIVGADGR